MILVHEPISRFFNIAKKKTIYINFVKHFGQTSSHESGNLDLNLMTILRLIFSC